MIDKRIAQEVLDAALESGGDFSELFMEDTTGTTISMANGTVENASYKRNCGAGVRVLKGTRSAYAYTADMSRESLLWAAKAASAIIEGNDKYSAKDFMEKKYSITPSVAFSQIDNNKRIALMKQAYEAAKSYSAEISQVTVRYLDVDKNIFVCNSNGVFASDRRPRTRMAIQSVASSGTEFQTGFEGPGLGMGFEAYDKIDVCAAAIQSAKTAVTMLHAPECPSGIMPVVIDGGFGGVIFHEACGHSLEATAVAKGNSVFCGKLGQKIASDKVSAVDDGTLKGEWGTISIDDEGTPSTRNLLIENGILKNYMIDLLGSRIMNMPVTGSSRRESYEYAPTSRMTNTFILAGEDDEDEMISSMGDGIFASRMGGGSVNPITGEFNFAVSEGYLVKDGKIVSPVRGATLIGKGSQILLKIDRVGKKLWLGQGMCGSVSGSIPTNVGQPRIRVSEITVGGRG